MTTAVETGIEVAPIHIDIPEEKLEDLRPRVAAVDVLPTVLPNESG